METTTNINICLVQSDIDSADKQKNFANDRALLAQMRQQPDLIVLPEMFSCGFSEDIVSHAETMQGMSVQFMKDISLQYHAVVIGSVPIKENASIYNRLFWIFNGEIVYTYDKRHLYFGCEKTYLTAGHNKSAVQFHAWNMMPLICYDIRFPKWCRNEYDAKNKKFLYDILIVIANFPSVRADAFQTLLTTRAIENQAYVFAVNRIGKDGYDNEHKGQTQIIDPFGMTLAQMPDYQQGVLEYAINQRYLEKSRLFFPVFEDWD